MTGEVDLGDLKIVEGIDRMPAQQPDGLELIG